MKKLLIIGAMAMALAPLAARAEDPYIESMGTTGIDTGYHLTPNSRLEVEFALTTTDQVKQSRLFGPDYNNTKLGLTTGLYLTDSLTWGFGVGDGTSYGGHWSYYQNPNLNPRTYIPADIDRHKAVYDISGNRFFFITAGVTNWSQVTSYTFTQTSAQPVTLFARYRNETATVYELPIKARIYELKIYEDDVLVRDFEPCMMDGVAGFRDRVTESFVAGGKAPQTFTAGGDYVTYESPYVATPSDNSAYYIDTEYQASSNTCVMLDCAPLGTWTSGMSAWYLFFGYGKRPFSGYISGAGYGTQNVTAWDTGVVGLADLGSGVRRTFALDNFNHTAFALVAGVTNGVKTVTVSDETHPANTYTVKIAANYKNDSNYVPMKVYGCKIFESGALVRDFVPCVKDGVAGLKDEITGLFVSYPSDKQRITANSLTVGGNVLVEADPYIQGTGANGPYIVTDYKPCATTRAEIDFEQTVIDTSVTHYPFSVHSANAFTFGVYAFTNGRYGFNCRDDSSQWTHSNMPTQTLSRVKLVLDAKNGEYIAAEAGRTNQTYTFTTARTKTSTKELYIFSSNGDAAANRMPMKLYSFKLYEDDVLVRDYVPAVKDGVAGLQDQLPGGKFLAPATSSFTYGGVFSVEVSQSATKVACRNTVVLTASAPGATSYRWLKNGEPIEGGTNGTLTVNWRSPKDAPTDTYRAVAVYAINGLTAESEPSAEMTVENLPAGMCVIFK